MLNEQKRAGGAKKNAETILQSYRGKYLKSTAEASESASEQSLQLTSSSRKRPSSSSPVLTNSKMSSASSSLGSNSNPSGFQFPELNLNPGSTGSLDNDLLDYDASTTTPEIAALTKDIKQLQLTQAENQKKLEDALTHFTQNAQALMEQECQKIIQNALEQELIKMNSDVRNTFEQELQKLKRDIQKGFETELEKIETEMKKSLNEEWKKIKNEMKLPTAGKTKNKAGK